MAKGTPAIRDILEALVGREMPGTRKVPDPVRIVAQMFDITALTARKYLQRLANADLATLSHGEQGSISHLFLPPEEKIPERLAALEPPAPLPLPTPPPPRSHMVTCNAGPPEEPRPSAAPAPATELAAVLVDVDNVVIPSRQGHLNISWAKLKEYLRETFGKLGFSDAFIGPRTDDDLIALLWDNGFDVITCPMGSKDKDSVDEKMRMRALKYLLTTGISHVVIVSRDADFRPLVVEAADRGKQVTLVDTTGLAARLAGMDAPVILKNSRPLERYLDAVGRVRHRLNHAADPDCQFITHVASLVRLDFQQCHDCRRPGDINVRVRKKLLAKWSPRYLVQDIDAAIRALLQSGALANAGKGLRIHTSNELWKHVP